MITHIMAHMARCTAPIHGHRTSSGQAACLHAVAVMAVGTAAMGLTHPRRIRLRRIRLRGAAADPAAAQDRTGRKQVLQ